mmetsp:Transcript_18011/g.50349  ORF Transcript_18011/g.50349 Transcript_18011/m.50349 type:complete len:227 (-) Transcript_18011:757-1437(-)
MCPVLVNFAALVYRLSSTPRTRSGSHTMCSTLTKRSGCSKQTSVLLPIMAAIMQCTSATSCSTSASVRTMSSALPASILKKSRKLDTVDSRMEPDTRMVLASSCCSSSSIVSSSISAEARQPLRGVRTSWHMRLINSLLASLAAFSRATDTARCAAWAWAVARARCALMRACASRSSLSCAHCARRWLANIWRRYHSARYAMRPPTAQATTMCTSASCGKVCTLRS